MSDQLEMNLEVRSIEKVFDQSLIRTVHKNGKIYYSIVDTIAVLVSTSPGQYWTKVKLDFKQSKLQPFWLQLKIPSKDGKLYNSDCTDQQGILRIIQSIPSPKVEPIKQWMAQLGRERIEEIKDPALGIERANDRYRKIWTERGLSKEEIEAHISMLNVRKGFTNELKVCGVEKDVHYAIISDDVNKYAMGMSVKEHEKLKKIPRYKLREHMTKVEMAFMTFAETVAQENLETTKPRGYTETRKAVGTHAEKVIVPIREAYEKGAGKPIATPESPVRIARIANDKQLKLGGI